MIYSRLSSWPLIYSYTFEYVGTSPGSSVNFNLEGEFFEEDFFGLGFLFE